MTITIHVGDALEVLRTLPAESVHCVVTSPPFYGLRDYGVDGQMGLEPTLNEYLTKMVALFREVRRVMRLDATAWVEMGDTYNAGTNANRRPTQAPVYHGGWTDGEERTIRINASGFKPKDLMGVPWRLALALQEDGWWLRSDIIWSRPNPMPESVTDRPTKAHSYVFLLSKSARYFYDAEAVREPDSGQDHARRALDGQPSLEPSGGLATPHAGIRTTEGRNGSGRNLRSVWHLATEPFPGSHFATMPTKLVEPCVKAGTSERGCCATCGAPWERVVEKELQNTRGKVGEHKGQGRADVNDAGSSFNWSGGVYGMYKVETIGFRPTCAHGGDPVPATILDPFFGAGTVGLVADRLGRNAIGIELNPEYARMAEKRIRTDCPMFTEVIRK